MRVYGVPQTFSYGKIRNQSELSRMRVYGVAILETPRELSRVRACSVLAA